MGKPFLVDDCHLKTQLDVNLMLHCIVQYAYYCLWLHMAMKCLFYIYEKRRLLCTVEINFAFASLWLLIFVTWGRAGE